MVEVRSSTHLNSQLHYIRAIKDGSIKIVANVAPKGKSKLKFRPLVDVYNRGNTEDEVPMVSRAVRELENDSERTHGAEDFDMTLEKVRKQCREKKRKRRGDDTETVSQVEVKEESSSLALETEEEGCEVEEPLSCWKTTLSKRVKKRQVRKSKRGSSTSSPSAKNVDLLVFCDVKPEPSWNELVTVDVNLENQIEDEGCDVEEPLSSWNAKRSKKKQKVKAKCGSTSSPSAMKVGLHVLCDVKPEAAWDDSYLVPEAMNIVSTNPLLDFDKDPESTSNKVLVEKVMHDLPKDARLVPYSNSEQPNSPGMVATEDPITTKPVDKSVEDASEEFIDARKAPCCLVDTLALENILCGSVSREDDVLEMPKTAESEAISCVKNLSYSNTSSGNVEVKEDEENKDSKANLDMITTGLDIMKIDAPEILTGLDMTITGLEIVKVDTQEMLAAHISDSLTIGYGVGNTELVWENEDIANDELHEAIDVLLLTGCCDPMDNLHSVPGDSAVSLEEDHLPERLQQSSSSGDVVVHEAGDHKSSQLLQAPTDEAKAAEKSDSIQQQELHSQPEKLLSGRKTLSPNSQAKLCKAMEHSDSPEKMCKKSKVKLYFSSQSSHRILKAQGLDVDVVPNPKQAIRKAKTQYQRATNKFSRGDTQAAKPQPFSTGRTSLQGCTQKAIAFSQGQIRDFQYVAAKLTKELKSMRQITKRCLLAESNPSIIPECNLDEVKTLIGKAEKTEESSKKWLSMIERDCNRFCKLMGMVTEDSPDTENIVQKKKKIKFADDAGGDLCHVKVFEVDLESES